jgi:hypothetical protein
MARKYAATCWRISWFSLQVSTDLGSAKQFAWRKPPQDGSSARIVPLAAPGEAR